VKVLDRQVFDRGGPSLIILTSKLQFSVMSLHWTYVVTYWIQENFNILWMLIGEIKTILQFFREIFTVHQNILEGASDTPPVHTNWVQDLILFKSVFKLSPHPPQQKILLAPQWPNSELKSYYWIHRYKQITDTHWPLLD
jgi:hypothetical protein